MHRGTLETERCFRKTATGQTETQIWLVQGIWMFYFQITSPKDCVSADSGCKLSVYYALCLKRSWKRPEPLDPENLYISASYRKHHSRPYSDSFQALLESANEADAVVLWADACRPVAPWGFAVISAAWQVVRADINSSSRQQTADASWNMQFSPRKGCKSHRAIGLECYVMLPGKHFSFFLDTQVTSLEKKSIERLWDAWNRGAQNRLHPGK